MYVLIFSFVLSATKKFHLSHKNRFRMVRDGGDGDDGGDDNDDDDDEERASE